MQESKQSDSVFAVPNGRRKVRQLGGDSEKVNAFLKFVRPISVAHAPPKASDGVLAADVAVETPSLATFPAWFDGDGYFFSKRRCVVLSTVLESAMCLCCGNIGWNGVF